MKFLLPLLFFLPFNAFAAVILDAAHDSGDNNGATIDGVTSYSETFTAVNTLPLAYIDLLINENSCSDGVFFKVELKPTNAGTPVSAAGAIMEANVDCVNMGTGTNWIRFTGTTTPTLTATEIYQIVGSATAGNPQWRMNTVGNPYASGASYECTLGAGYGECTTWSVWSANLDTLFRVYVTEADPAAPPSSAQLIIFGFLLPSLFPLTRHFYV